MFIEVIKAEYIEGYRLLLLFNNGERRIVDLSNSLKGSVYIPLKDINYFKNFSIKFNTIEWENGADFAPEYLYERCIRSLATRSHPLSKCSRSPSKACSGAAASARLSSRR